MNQMPNRPLSHDDFLDVLSIINASQRGRNDPHRIEVSYSYDSVTGEYSIAFAISERGLAEELEYEGFEVTESGDRFYVRTDERRATGVAA